MFLKKTPKPKGTYLAITESYYDKEKKATRQKTVMGLGYLEDLKKEYPDPVAHFEQVVVKMNQERENRKNSVVYVDLTASLSPSEITLRNVGYGVLKYIYKELQLDIFWRTKTWNLDLPYNMEEIFRFFVISQALYPDVVWDQVKQKNLYFEEFSPFPNEHVVSALSLIVKYQRDIQKWLYEHSLAFFPRDLSTVFLDHSSYNFSLPGAPVSESQPGTRRTDSVLNLDLLTDHQGIPIAFDLFNGDMVLNQSVSNAVKKIRRDCPQSQFVRSAAKPPKMISHISDDFRSSGFVYGKSVHTADAEFKEWVLRAGYQEMRIESRRGNPYIFQYKERTVNETERQFVCYHEFLARQQRIARESSGKKTGLRLDGYSAIITSGIRDDRYQLFLLYNGLRQMESVFRVAKEKFDSAPAFIWTPDRINAHFVVSFVSMMIMRLLQAKLDFVFPMSEITASLQRYDCVQIAGNIYQFTYYDDVLDACEKALGLGLHNKYRSQVEIRRLLRY